MKRMICLVVKTSITDTPELLDSIQEALHDHVPEVEVTKIFLQRSSAELPQSGPASDTSTPKQEQKST